MDSQKRKETNVLSEMSFVDLVERTEGEKVKEEEYLKLIEEQRFWASHLLLPFDDEPLYLQCVLLFIESGLITGEPNCYAQAYVAIENLLLSKVK